MDEDHAVSQAGGAGDVAEHVRRQGVDVQVAGDATASRATGDRDTGLHRMERAGATVTGVEAALFELLGQAGTPEFKAVQELIK